MILPRAVCLCVCVCVCVCVVWMDEKCQNELYFTTSNFFLLGMSVMKKSIEYASSQMVMRCFFRGLSRYDESSQVKSSQSKSIQVKSSQSKSIQVKSSQSKPAMMRCSLRGLQHNVMNLCLIRGFLSLFLRHGVCGREARPKVDCV